MQKPETQQSYGSVLKGNNSIPRSINVAETGGTSEFYQQVIDDHNNSIRSNPLTNAAKDSLITILFTILNSGSYEAFNAFMQDPKAKQSYDAVLNENNSALISINLAAAGGNAKLLQQVINDYKGPTRSSPLTNHDIALTILKENKHKKTAIDSAITSTDPECLRVLLHAFEIAGTSLDNESKLR